MIQGMRTCPECRTRVLPNPDNTCPACRKHKFDASVSEHQVRASIAIVKKAERAEHEHSVWRGARAFWLLQWTVGVTILLSTAKLTLLVGGGSSDGVGAAQSVLAIAALISGIAALVAAYRVASWLRWSFPAGWAVLAAVPYLGLMVLLIMSRTAITRLREHGVAVGWLGPEIPRRPPLADEA
jgi:hypothetical protein